MVTKKDFPFELGIRILCKKCHNWYEAKNKSIADKTGMCVNCIIKEDKKNETKR